MEALDIQVCEEDNRPTKLSRMHELVDAHAKPETEAFPLRFLGDASRNRSIMGFLARLKMNCVNVSPRLFTCLPRDEATRSFLSSAINILNEDYLHEAPEFEWRIFSTSEAQRKREMGEVISLAEIGKLVEKYPSYKPGKIILSFSPDADVDVGKIKGIFDPEQFAIRLEEPEGLPLGMMEMKDMFADAGYDVL